MCKEVDKKMDTQTHQNVNSYVALFDVLSEKTDSEASAIAILQEMSKDKRAEQIRGERAAQNGDVATPKQKRFMKKLGLNFPENISRKEASVLIDEELSRNGE